MTRNIIFDMGKVILDYNPVLACYRHSRDWDKAIKLHAAIFGTPDWCRLVDGGLMTDQEYAKEVQKLFADPEMKTLAENVLQDWWADSLYLITGMEQLIKDLLAAGIQLFLLSNVGYSFHKFCYKIPCLDQFSGVMLSCEEKLSKPDPALFQRLCDRYNIVPEETLFVDDWEPNTLGAQSIGLQGYCFADMNVNRLREYLVETLKIQL